MRSPAGVIRIRIPGAVGAKDARGLGADAATFDTPANDTAEPVVQIANVRAAPDGAPSLQMLTRIPSLDAPSSYRFELDLPPGARMVPAADGGIVVLKGSEKNGEAVATIAAPWARDANGASVPVRYEIADRTSIVMHVDLTAPGLVAPVIADPWVQWSWHGVTVHFSRSETAWIGSVGQYGCPYFGGWPAVACTVVVATMSWAFRTAASHGYCLSVWKPYWSYWTATPWFRHC